MRTRRILRARPRNELTYLREGSQLRRAADQAFDQRLGVRDGGSQLRELGDAEYHQGVANDGFDQRPARAMRARR